MSYFIIFVLLLVVGGLVYALKWQGDEAKKKERALRASDEVLKRYAGIRDVDAHIIKEKAKLQDLRGKYDHAKQIISGLQHQIDELSSDVAGFEVGIEHPRFNFSDSQKYQEKILKVRERMKKMVATKTAMIAEGNFSLGGDEKKGRKMLENLMGLSISALNVTCENAMRDVKWNNVERMEKKIADSAADIEKKNALFGLRFSPEYLAARIDELNLVHGKREKEQVEKEERAELARAEKEEAKLMREQEQALKEEQKRQQELDKARQLAAEEEHKKREEMETLRARMAQAADEQSAVLQARMKALEDAAAAAKLVAEAKINELSQELQAAHDASQKATAMASITRCGYVYIISNVGSFGENVVKIGLTRRLDPNDRVIELGDASVPFGFDTHAMIYSENAPALEASLHNRFKDRRVNEVNMRKEFFTVSISEVKQAVKELAPEANFFEDQTSEEYRESLARRASRLQRKAMVSSPN